MNAERLLALFDRIADAPDSIPRLRRFVLDLAVRGKLLPQDPNDEPAAALLKRIPNAQYSFEPLTPTDLPFEAPFGWSWTRLGQVCSKTGSGSTPRGGKSVYRDSGIPFLRSQNVYNDGLRLDDVAYIDTETHERMEGTAVRPADLLLNITGGSIGRCCRVPDDFAEANVSQHVAIIRVAAAGIQDFLHRVILSPYFQSFIIDEQTGAGRGGLPKNKMDRIPVPLPPLAEQRRIVAAVDELMVLCDRLEASQMEREDWRDRLTRASLARLDQPDDDAAAFRNHARFTLDHLPRLATRPEHVTQLRHTILNLAVRGKLVPQDPNDEPAAELLKQIAMEKSKFLKQAGTRAITPLAVNAATHTLPTSWAWVRFGDVVFSRDGERIPVSKEERNTRAKTYDYYGASGVIDKIDGFLFDKPLLLIGEDGANLINRSTPIAFIARGQYWVNNHAHVLDGISELFLRYLELHINAIDLKPYVTGTAQPKMNQAKMNSIPIALPPLAEQRRIVARVDELMAVCDRLEAQLTTAQTDRGRLLEAVLHDALSN